VNFHADNTAPEPALLIIADISGYTRYMTANAKTLAHSQTLIIELVESLIHQVEAPLEVAKLEGDAIFLFCRKPSDAARWQEICADISRKLLEFFQCFREKLAQLGRSNTCTCHGCTHLEKLRLKIIIHSGLVLFHRVLQFNELAGTDVIIVHRLLKNSIQAGQYLLLTEAARRELEFPETITFKSSSEKYEDLGLIQTAFHDFDSHPEAPIADTAGNNFGARYRESLWLKLRLWFAPFASRKKFQNLPADSRRLGRLAFAALTAVLTPIFVPVAALLVVFHTLKTAK
jgi:class 3 adenylate cyclase